jgi:thiamine biosynthesis lipoprotein
MTRTSSEEPLRRDGFRAMGTWVSLIAPMAGVSASRFERAAALVAAEFEEQEERCSRFRPTSELSQVNAAAGRPIRLSPPLASLVGLALEAADTTEGLFDPTVLRAVVAAGYDRDFADLLLTAREVLRPAGPTGRWRELEREGDLLTMPAGVALDLGGIAKGWTADRAAARVGGLLPWAIVDAGGDLRVVGDLPSGGLEVGVEDPGDPDREVLRLALTAGALATSSIVRRSWGPDQHHLIDPRTGRPSVTDVVQATVWAPTCVEAEVRTKEALLRGEPALARLTATLVHRDGTVRTNMGVPAAA